MKLYNVYFGHNNNFFPSGAQEGADPRYLRNIRTDDEFLAKILRTRAFNLERAYKSVRENCQMYLGNL